MQQYYATTLRLPSHLSIKVLIGAILGIVTGILFGQSVSFLKPITEIYVMLLQIVVYPYLICSLIHGLGQLTPSVSVKLFKRGWPFYLLLVILSFIVLYPLAKVIPSTSSFLIDHIHQGKNIDQLIQLFIPENVIVAIAKNYLPAVIIFSVLFGLALQHQKEKTAFLNILEAVRATSIRIWEWLVFLSPYALFTLLAYTSGTINFENLRGLGEYIALYFIGVLFISFILLPCILATLTNFSYKTILKYLKETIVVAIATNLTTAAIPLIIGVMYKILDDYKIHGDESKELVRTTTSISYPLGTIGNHFLYLFIFFAAFYYHVNIAHISHLLLATIITFSAIGTTTATVNAAIFLANFYHLPSISSALYVELMALTRYGQVLVSSLGIASLTILVTLGFYKKIKFNLKYFLFSLISLFIFYLAFYIASPSVTKFVNNKQVGLLDFNLNPKLSKSVHVTFVKSDAKNILANNLVNMPTFARIVKTHLIRVGYNPYMMPFVYFNNKKQLVGYDVAFIYALAKSLNANVEFIPYQWSYLIEDIKQNKFDIAIGSIYVTAKRLTQVNYSDPYYKTSLAFIVKNSLINKFSSRDSIINNKALKITVFKDPILVPLAKKNFLPEQIQIINHIPIRNLTAQAVFWTREHASAYAALLPQYSSIIPQGLIQKQPLLIAFMVNKNSPVFLNYINHWLHLMKISGFTQEQRQYWLMGTPRKNTSSRIGLIKKLFDKDNGY